MLDCIINRGRWLLAALVLIAGFPAGVGAQEFFTVRELLAQQFKSSERVSFVRVQPNAEQQARIARKLGRKLAKPDYTFYVARSGERIDGYALFDEELGQHEPISFATFFDAEGHVTRVEVVAYREAYGDGVRAERFRKQFVGRDAHSGYAAKHDIDTISGATISSRSLCTGVQRAAVLLEETILHDRAVLATR